MSLTRVTITGADDAVSLADLLKLSEEFDFVEWGILLSQSRAGTPRYPSRGWLNRFSTEFFDFVVNDCGLAAAHLCGVDARAAFGHDFSWIDRNGYVFGRVQLNGFERFLSDDNALASVFRLALGRPERQFILQAPTDAALRAAQTIASVCRSTPDDGIRNVSALFDPSGGKGLSVHNWPLPPLGLHVGYAGGIGPDNVGEVIEAVSSVSSRDFWLDMESSIRTNEAFDLDKVRRVLERAKPFVRAPRGGR